VSKSEIIAQHLPFLRRYARALTGSQKSGDAYVTAVLEAMLEEPESFPGGREPRVALYRAFTKVWGSLAEKNLPDPDAARLPVEKRLTQLTPRMRQIPARKSAILSVLDVGASKIVCLIARLTPMERSEALRGRTHRRLGSAGALDRAVRRGRVPVRDRAADPAVRRAVQ